MSRQNGSRAKNDWEGEKTRKEKVRKRNKGREESNGKDETRRETRGERTLPGGGDKKKSEWLAVTY